MRKAPSSIDLVIAAYLAVNTTLAVAQVGSQKLPTLGPPLSAPKIQTPQLQAPQLQPLATRYSADAANPGFQGSANAGGVAWQCAGGKCSASGPATSPTVQVCSELARTAGALRSFAYGQNALGPNELGQCNAVVASVPKQEPGSLPPMGGLPAIGAPKPNVMGAPPQLGGLAPLPMVIAPPAMPDAIKPDIKSTPALQPQKPQETLQAAPLTVAPSATIRLPPVNITTGALSFTGSRFESANITTGTLSFTGSRFESANITTGTLSFTGNR